MIYFIQAEGIGHIKIGFTDGDDAASRLATLQTGSPVPLRVLHTMPGTMDDEKNLHRKFAAHSTGGEWFKAVPDLLALIPQTERKTCEGIEIAERSVSIRALTVGRKQFSKSLFNQLLRLHLFDWPSYLAEAQLERDNVYGITEKTLYTFLSVPPSAIWGWVHGDHGREAIFITEDRLARSPFYPLIRTTSAGEGWFGCPFSATQIHSLRSCYLNDKLIPKFPAPEARYLSALFMMLPGFRDEDQLFIGV